VNKKWKIYRCLGGPRAWPVHEPSRLAAVASDSVPQPLRPPVAVVANLHALWRRQKYAADLTAHAINPAYKQLLGDGKVQGLPISQVFNGRDVEQLISMLRTAAQESLILNTDPIVASVNREDGDDAEFTHHRPVSDATGSTVTRLFLFSEG